MLKMCVLWTFLRGLCLFSRLMSDMFIGSVQTGSDGRVCFSEFKILDDAIIISEGRRESDQPLV